MEIIYNNDADRGKWLLSYVGLFPQLYFMDMRLSMKIYERWLNSSKPNYGKCRIHNRLHVLSTLHSYSNLAFTPNTQPGSILLQASKDILCC